MEVRMCYRDDAFVAVDKPSGLMVHPQEALIGTDAPVELDLMRVVRDQVGRYVYPVHRLDRGTSGVVLFALDQVAARHLSQQFYTGVIDKVYVALVRGWSSDAGVITEPVKPGPRAGAERVSARTEYRTLARYEIPRPVGRYASARWSLVEMHPRSGRYHQLRTHLRGLSHPMLGDRQHGDRAHNVFADEFFGVGGLWLRCVEMEVFHPVSGRRTRVDLGLDDRWRGGLARLQEYTVTDKIGGDGVRDGADFFARGVG